MQDKNLFSRKLDDIIGMFTTKPLDSVSYEYFWKVAQDHPDRRVLRAMDSMATTCKHCPRPADLREHLTIASEGSGEQEEWLKKYEEWQTDKRLYPDDYPDDAWIKDWLKNTERVLGFKLDLSKPAKRTREEDTP